MGEHASDIRTHVFAADDRLMLDANVWLSIYGPDPTRRNRSAVYQNAFRRMREAESQLHLEVIVLSEFINSWARLVYNQRCPDGQPGRARFKHFRSSPDFQPVAEEIAIQATHICCAVTRCETGFASCDVGSLLAEFGQGRSDFNDLMLANLCSKGGLIFVTDDGDFEGSDHAILTANRRLLH
ncbi:PIN domain-containing protein [bacterium]|nr:PIN domain-containing protein [bacterium]